MRNTYKLYTIIHVEAYAHAGSDEGSCGLYKQEKTSATDIHTFAYINKRYIYIYYYVWNTFYFFFIFFCSTKRRCAAAQVNYTRPAIHTTIFPSRLPTFRHLPRTTGRAGNRRVIATAAAAGATAAVASVRFVFAAAAAVHIYGRVWRISAAAAAGQRGAGARTRGTSSPGSMGLCTMNQFFPLCGGRCQRLLYTRRA